MGVDKVNGKQVVLKFEPVEKILERNEVEHTRSDNIFTSLPSHPYLAKPLDKIQLDGQVVHVMEYLDGAFDLNSKIVEIMKNPLRVPIAKFLLGELLVLFQFLADHRIIWK